MIKILLSAALAVAVGFCFYQHRVIKAQERTMRMQELNASRERLDLLRALDDAKALAVIIERENKLALADPPTGQKKLSGDKSPFGNRIVMDLEPRSERTSLPRQRN